MLLTIMLGLFTLTSLFSAWKAIKIYTSVPKNRDVDVSDENRPLPPLLQDYLAPLIERGFKRLGEYATVWHDSSTEMGTAWCYKDTSGQTVLVTVTARNSPYMEFSTVFPDNALLETKFPRGETIDSPDFRVQAVVSASPITAYERHLAEIPEFSTVHGSPIIVQDMTHRNEIGQMTRSRYGQRSLQPKVWEVVSHPFMFGVFFLLLITKDLAGENLSLQEDTVITLGALNLILITLPFTFHGPRRASRIFVAGMLGLFLLLPLIWVTSKFALPIALGMCLLVPYYLYSARKGVKQYLQTTFHLSPPHP